MYLSPDAAAEARAIDPSPEASLQPAAGLVARAIRRLLRPLERGRLTVILPSGERIEHLGRLPGREAVMRVRSLRAFRRLVTAGDVGFAEGFIAGDWSSPDLVALIALAAENVERLQRTMDGAAPLRIARKLRHALRRNSRAGSRRNIGFHYDLGNDFYRLWLDDGMTYSSALSLARGETLEAAQAAKLDRVAALVGARTGDRVLEIGCGWGALAARLARDGAHVTGLTLSREQLGHARARIAAERLDERVELRLQDYRDVAGGFERIVSIEMLEAVGEAYWPTYFETIAARLAPGGRAVLQVITMREDRFEQYRRGTDFIQRYVFPGGMLPSPAIISREAETAGLRLVSTERFGSGYAQTLAEWRRRFEARWPAIAALGFDERFHRLWTYYLSYCEAGFAIGTIDVGLYVLEGRE